MTTANTATDFATLIVKANGQAKQRTLNPATIEQYAVATYAKGVEWCDKLGLPYGTIRVEITGGEKLANSYKYRADMTWLSFAGGIWSAGRSANKAPLARGEVFLLIAAPTEKGERKALDSKAAAIGLKVRKAGAIQDGTTESGEIRYVDAVEIFAA